MQGDSRQLTVLRDHPYLETTSLTPRKLRRPEVRRQEVGPESIVGPYLLGR